MMYDHFDELCKDVDELQTDDEFRLTAPEEEDSDEDSLGEQTTNLSIEIELVETVADAMQRLDKGAINFENLEKKVKLNG
jgi:hypothetical protein